MNGLQEESHWILLRFAPLCSALLIFVEAGRKCLEVAGADRHSPVHTLDFLEA